jgi:hypothetical protein
MHMTVTVIQTAPQFWCFLFSLGLCFLSFMLLIGCCYVVGSETSINFIISHSIQVVLNCMDEFLILYEDLF